MLVNVDSKHLDWTAAVYLAQDQVGIQEIVNNWDIHSDNQKVFQLPSRLIAKIFLFRIIFGGTAYSFANDNDFAECGFSEKEWEEVIERFYSKYKGIAAWHKRLVDEATEKGVLSIPTGRSWSYSPSRNKRGELVWPITKIKNYPVQGLEADLMAITRVSLFNRIKKHARYSSILLISTVHDSILLDVPIELVPWVVDTIYSVFNDVPDNFEKLFGIKFNLPFRGEVKVGNDYLNMKEYSGEQLQ